jgi:hypothetical protein
MSGGVQGTKIVYNINNVLNFIVYGYDSSGNPRNLYVKTGNPLNGENGIGFVGNDNEIDTNNFAQIDLGDFNRIKNLKCADPTIKIGSIQLNEGFSVYGSNQLGVMGTQLYTYTSTLLSPAINDSKEIIIPSYNTTDKTSTGDLFKYGTIPFRYISIKAISGDVTLNLLTLAICGC